MAQYDGSINIDTKINTDGIDKSISDIKKRLSTLSDYVKKAFSRIGNGIRSGLSGIGSAVKRLGSGMHQQIMKVDSDVIGLKGNIKRFGAAVAGAFAVSKIVQFGKSMTDLGSDLQEVQNVVDVTFTSMSKKVDEFARKAAVSAGLSETMAKRYVGTFGAMAKSFGFAENEAYKMSTSLTQLAGDVASFYNITQDEAYTKLKSVFTGETETLKDLGVVMTQAALDQYALANGFGKTTSEMTEQEKVALRYKFVLQQLSAASGDFVRTGDSWANQIRILKLQFESFMAAVGQGLINLLTPAIKALNVLMGKLVEAANVFKHFTEKITGKKSTSGGGAAGVVPSGVGNTSDEYDNAASSAEKLADSTEDVAKATKEAQEAAESYLNPLDEINKIGDQNKDLDLGLNAPGISPADIGSFDLGDMVEENASEAESVFSKFFKPLKKSWNREGKFVMDAWKYALGEVWKLIKDIGRDFLKVWQQPETIDMLSDMLHIVGDIGLIVGNLAKNFREAWNYNKTGLHILENIRDIFAAIIHNIRLAADRTVEWTKTLDFRPLLTSIEALTRSLIRFSDFLSGTMADFYTEFILPLTSWTLSEKGLPRLFNILAAFMNEINWEGLRSALKSLYQALEPYAEEIGNGLLDFIEKMKTEGVEFFNFLPGAIQRAADALRAGDLPAAFYEFGNISGEAVKTAFNIIKLAIESVPWGEIGTMIASFINGIPWGEVTGALFGALSASITGAIDFLYNFFTTIRWEDIGHTFGANLQRAWNAIDWQKAGLTVGAGIKGILDFMLATIQELDWGQIGRDIGTFLSAIPWGEIFSKVFAIIWDVLSGLISGLLDTKSGKIIVAIGAGVLAVKALFNAADFALAVAQWATGGTDKFTLIKSGAELLKTNLGIIMKGISALFSPTGLLIAAIAAAAILIITHWDEIKKAAGKVADWVGEKWEWLKGKFKSFGDFLSGVFAKDWSRNFGSLGDVFNGFIKNA